MGLQRHRVFSVLTDAPSETLYLLVATDPSRRNGTAEKARELVVHRLTAGMWPLFARTPNRKALVPGALVAFYLGGTGADAGCVVAIARVSEKRTNRSGRRIDPPGCGSEAPDQLLVVIDVRWLARPVRLKEAMVAAGQEVKNLGNMLQGGCRAFTDPAVTAQILECAGAGADEGTAGVGTGAMRAAGA